MTGIKNNIQSNISSSISVKTKVKFQMNYYLDDKTTILNILEKRKKEYIFHEMESNDQCQWTGEIEYEKNFVFKFIIVEKEENTILRFLSMDFFSLNDSNLDYIEISGCEKKFEDEDISFICTLGH